MLDYSVALCTYNGEKYIRQQLESILKQTIVPREIIISDDGSTDGTLKAAENILENTAFSWKIVRNAGSHGVAGNFLNAIRICSGDIIFTCDQDDVWVEKKAETMLRIFENNENAQLVFSNGKLVDKDLNDLHADMWCACGLTKRMLKQKKWFNYFLKHNYVTGAAMALKRECVCKIFAIPGGWLHDEWFALRLSMKDSAIFPCEEKLILYRQHTVNVVGMKKKNFFQKTREWFGNFSENLKNIRKMQQIRWHNASEICAGEIPSVYLKKIDRAADFWTGAYQLQNRGRIAGSLWILKNFFSGNYHRFYTGFRGEIRDLFVQWFNRKSKND